MVTIAKPFYERHDRKDHVILWKFPIETKTTNSAKIVEAIRAQPEFQKLRDLLTQAGNGGLLGVSERRVFDNDVGFVAATLWDDEGSK